MFNTVRFMLNHPLNRGRKRAAMARYLKWQIGSRILRHPVAVPFTDHARLLVATSMRGATGNYYCGLHEFEDMAFVLHFLRPGDEFVDVGANIGSYTVLSAKVCGAKTLAVEPVPVTFDRLCDNIALNQIAATTTAVRTGLGRDSGTLHFTRGLDTMNYVIPTGSADAETIECPVTTLDELCKGWRPIFVKMDVEGYEAEVVAGGSSVLAADSLCAVLMETNAECRRYATNGPDLHSVMLGFGFKPYRYHPFERRLEAVSTTRASNTLYIKDEALSAERVRAANPVLVFGRPI